MRSLLEFEGGSLIAYGIGSTFYKAMSVQKIAFVAMVDGGASVQGSLAFDKKIIAPDEMFSKYLKADFPTIIVFTPNFMSVRQELEKAGLIYRENFFYFLEFEEFSSVFELICEEREFRFLRRLICPGAICFDIGANVGLYSFLFSKYAGKSGQVVACEPIPINFLQLKHHSQLFDFDNSYLINRAVSDGSTASGQMVMPYNEGVPLTGHAHLTDISHVESEVVNDAYLRKKIDSAAEDDNLNSGECFEVSITSVDEICSDLKFSTVDFIQIDVEGAEFEVLEGATASIDNFKPLLQLELFWSSVTVDAVISRLLKTGYQMYFINARDNVVQNHKNRIQKEIKNYFFCHPDSSSEMTRRFLNLAG